MLRARDSVITVAAAAAVWAIGCAVYGADLTLVDNGQPTATIVVPDQEGPVSKIAAETLVKYVRLASGAEMTVARESTAPAGTKIYVGMTQAAEKAGLGLHQLKGMECVLKVVDGNLYLAGNDVAVNVGRPSGSLCEPSRKAVHILLHDYVGVRWLIPNDQGHGTYVPRKPTLAIPAGLDRRWAPVFQWMRAGNLEGVEDWGFLTSSASPDRVSGGAHTYPKAVPKEIYAKEHPEYFALLNGVRTPDDNHLCISNPDVQRLFKEEIVRNWQKGFDVVSLGQTDGYKPCECDNCRAIDADPAERIWIVHDKIARDLQKEYPGKMVMFVAYSPNWNPPRTMPKFSDNVVLMPCSYSREDFTMWRGRVKAFYAYVYNWGPYHEMGFGPKVTPAMAALQVRLFRDEGVRGISVCNSYGASWGLEGPGNYAFKRLCEDPDLDYREVEDEYYQCAFGEAAAPMKEFFNALHLSIDFHSQYGDWDPWGPEMAAFNPEAHYTFFFPPVLIAKLDSLLAEAKELAKDREVKLRLAQLERNYLYNRDIATVFHFSRAYQMQPSWELFDPLAQAIKTRNARIEEFLALGDENHCIDGFPPMFPTEAFPKWNRKGMSSLDAQRKWAMEGGKSRAVLPAPFDWDPDKIHESGKLPPLRGKEDRHKDYGGRRLILVPPARTSGEIAAPAPGEHREFDIK